jgi:tRNA A37 methylthiotransferase MiaB
MKSVCIAFGLGCPRAQVDTARLCEYVRANGWSIADRLEEADLVFVTTCGYDAEQEKRSFNLLNSADRRRKAGSRLVVVGCLAGIDEAGLRATFDADLVPPKCGAELDAILGATVKLCDVSDPNEIEPYIKRASRCFDDTERHPDDGRFKAQARSALVRSGIRELLVRGGRNRKHTYLWPTERVFSIRVAEGCMGECTYCAIRFAAGPLHSKPLRTVLAEFDAGLARGYTQFKLIAGDLGCYGQDVGTNVAELLSAMMGRSADFQLTLLDFDLKWFITYSDALVDLFARHQARVRFLAVPLQSGSERTLQHMRRGHTAEDAERALLALRKACPDMVLGTHVLVGFPGETERDFEDTLNVLRAVRFDRVDFYDYQDRPRTEASAMPDKVPRDVIKSRSLRARRELGGRWAGLEYRAKEWHWPTTLRPPRPAV